MNPDETPYDSFYGNLFGVRKSVRYHQRRQAFHEWWNTVIIALAFASSASAMAEWRQLLIGTTSFLLMLNWVVGLTRRANAHAKLGQRFASLEQDMVPFEKNRDLEAQDEERFRRRRLEIEAGEPAKLRVMDILCHNELCEAAYPQHTTYRVAAWQRWLGHFVDIDDSKIQPSNAPRKATGLEQETPSPSAA